MFSYQNLDVYKRSVEFLALAQGIIERCPKGCGPLADQLRRAALSIPLNIAEGSGKASGGDARRYYSIARGSAMECGAIMDACKVLGIIDEEMHGRSNSLLVRVAQMLSKMCGKSSTSLA